MISANCGNANRADAKLRSVCATQRLAVGASPQRLTFGASPQRPRA